MTRLVRATELMGLTVVTLDRAAAVGEVRDVLFDPGRSRVVAFTVRGRGLLSPPLVGLLPATAVRAIGRDAVLIADENALVTERDGMVSALDNQVEVLGKEVVTDAGTTLGDVVDVVLEVEAGEAVVVGCEVSQVGDRHVILPLSPGMPLSSDALVVPAAFETYAANGLSGFRDVLARARRVHA